MSAAFGGWTRSIRRSQYCRFGYHMVTPTALFCAIFASFVARQNAWYEWANYLWLIQQQVLNVHARGLPSLFIHTNPGGVFYPWFAFYGGGLWSLSAYVAIAFGSVWVSFLGMLAAAFAACYAGMWWLGRQAGLSRADAHLPSIIVVASPYFFVANVYGRGDWAEAIALGFVPLAVAGGIAVATRRRVRLGALSVFFAFAAIAASHNVTLLWGSVYCCAIAAVLLFGVRGTAALPAVRSFATIAAAAANGVLLNAWFLLPDIAYGRETRVYGTTQGTITALSAFDQPRVIFSPWPFIPKGAAGTLHLQAPLYPLLWSIVALPVAAFGLGRFGRRSLFGLASLTAVTISLLVHDGTWTHFPALVRSLQFPLRLHAYLVLLVAGLVMLGLLGTRNSRRARAWRTGALIAVATQAAMTIGVTWTTRPVPHIHLGSIVPSIVPASFPTWQQQQFRLATDPHVAAPARLITISPQSARTGIGVATRTGVPAGTKFGTNVVASPLEQVSGSVLPIGRDANGQVVVVARAGGTVRLQVSAAHPWPVVVGDGLTLLAFALVAGVGFRWYGTRRHPA